MGSIKRNLNEVAIDGECKVFRDSVEFYGGDQSESFLSAVLRNPTWLELMVLAERGIIATNDYHHVFFEGVRKSKRKSAWPEYKLVMGS